MIKRKKISHDIYSLTPLLTNALKKETDIIFAYLFGSYGRRKVTPLSDVDIAVYIEPVEDIWERKLGLISLITRVLRTDEVDLIILNEATPSLIRSVMDTGNLLFSKDEEKRITFLTRGLQEYLDMGYYRIKIWEAMRRRIKAGKFGF